MKFLNWLNKPYPFVNDIKHKLLISFSFGLFIYFFLIIFQPFGIDKIIGNKSIYLIGFGLITSIALLFNYTILPLLFPKLFDLDKWVIGKEICFVLFIITLISLLNYYYNSVIGYGLSEQHSLPYFVFFTVSVGFFPVLMLVFVTELFLTTKHQKAASKISSMIQMEREIHETIMSPIIEIITESKNDSFTISENDLIFIKSEDNYCKVFYTVGEEFRVQLLRITLKNIEKQLEAFPGFIRSHRSFIVNKKQISEITGNARAYYVHFYNCDEVVPISRSFPKEKLL